MGTRAVMNPALMMASYGLLKFWLQDHGKSRRRSSRVFAA